jgi:hypothetical protein
MRRRKKETRVATGRQIRYGRVLGLLIIAGGFAAIGLGWVGTARLSCTDCQIPYLLSGGAAGLGLLIFGVTILVVAQLRAEGRRTADRLDRLEGALIEALRPGQSTPTPTVPLKTPEADREAATRDGASDRPAFSMESKGELSRESA